MMEQLLLDFEQLRAPVPCLDNFVVGDNVELMAYLQRQTVRQENHYDVCCVFGVSGAGKTHLLRAIGKDRLGIYIDAAQEKALENLSYEDEQHTAFIAIDHIDQLNDAGQQRLFHLCNLAKEAKLALLVAAKQPPAELSLRKDLQLRLSQGIVYQLLPLSDEQKLSALKNYANARDMVIADEVLSYLLNRTSRDLSNLIGLLDIIDQASLSQQLRPTLPMVRQVLSAFQKRESC